MNKINFFYPVTRGGLIPSATIRVPNNHADNFHISVNSGFILDEHPFRYYYDIDVNGFNFVSRRVINGFIEDNTMNNFIVNMTSNFTFNEASLKSNAMVLPTAPGPIIATLFILFYFLF